MGVRSNEIELDPIKKKKEGGSKKKDGSKIENKPKPKNKNKSKKNNMDVYTCILGSYDERTSKTNKNITRMKKKKKKKEEKKRKKGVEPRRPSIGM